MRIDPKYTVEKETFVVDQPSNFSNVTLINAKNVLTGCDKRDQTYLFQNSKKNAVAFPHDTGIFSTPLANSIVRFNLYD